jgi:hypothetical protein
LRAIEDDPMFRGRRSLLCLPILLASAAGWIGPLVPSTQGQTARDTHDFGVVRQGELDKVEHTFKVSNPGPAVMDVSRVETSCGCTGHILSASRIAPGKEATLDMAVDLIGKQGIVSETLELILSPPRPENPVFEIAGVVLASWVVEPAPWVDFGSVDRNSKQDRLLWLKSQYRPGEPAGRIARIVSKNASVGAATEEFETPTEATEGGWLEVRRPIRLTLSTGEEVGERDTRVLIGTDDVESPTHVLTVKWRTEGDIVFAPKTLVVTHFGGVSRGRTLSLSSQGKKAFEIESVRLDSEAASDDLTVQPGAFSSPTEKTFEISIDSKSYTERATRRGKVVFVTDRDDQPEIAVPYTAVFRP